MVTIDAKIVFQIHRPDKESIAGKSTCIKSKSTIENLSKIQHELVKLEEITLSPNRLKFNGLYLIATTVLDLFYRLIKK